MKLSEAMRLGAMLRPQVTRQLTRNGGTCAVGAAMEAVGISLAAMSDLRPVSYFVPKWHWVHVDEACCPVCFQHDFSCVIISKHLNDDHGWTREHIADWVATVEPQELSIEQEEPCLQTGN